MLFSLFAVKFFNLKKQCSITSLHINVTWVLTKVWSELNDLKQPKMISHTPRHIYLGMLSLHVQNFT